MSKNTTNVMPFKFDRQEVRTLLIDYQPWLYAVDVCASLGLADTNKALIGLDEDEKCEHEQYSGSGRKPVLINESGLYSLILRSRKAEAKRFKKWVTAEVLPAIRKHGRYEAPVGKMATLIGQTIGTDGFHMLGAVVKGKVTGLPKSAQRRAVAKIWSQTHAAFGVRSAADIPADQLDAARNFIAAYVVVEGEYIERESGGRQLPLNIHQPLDALTCRRPGMLVDRGNGDAWLDVTIADLHERFRSPCESILFELTRAGYDVSGAWWEIRTLKNKLNDLSPFLNGLSRVIEEPQRYAIKNGAAA